MKTCSGKSGGALVMVLLIVVIVSILSVGMLRLAGNAGVSAVYVEQSEQAFWQAEAGMQAALHMLRTNAIPYFPHQLKFDDGNHASYDVSIEQPDPFAKEYELISKGLVRGEERVLTMNPTLTISPSTTSNSVPPGILGLGGSQNRLNNSGTITGNVISLGELWVNGRSSPSIVGEVIATEGRNIETREFTGNDFLDISLDTATIADFSLTGSRPVYTTNVVEGVSRVYLQLDGGITRVTDQDLQSNGDFLIADGIVGEGTLIVPDLSGWGTDLKFSSAGAPYDVGDNIKVWVDGNIIAQKEGTFGDSVVVYTTGDMTVKKSATGTETAFYTEGDFTADKDLTLHGLIFAEGNVQVDGDLTLTGSLVAGESFWLKGGYDITAMDTQFFSSAFGSGITVNTYAVIPGTWNEPSTM